MSMSTTSFGVLSILAALLRFRVYTAWILATVFLLSLLVMAILLA